MDKTQTWRDRRMNSWLWLIIAAGGLVVVLMVVVSLVIGKFSPSEQKGVDDEESLRLPSTGDSHHPWDGVFLCGKQRRIWRKGELIKGDTFSRGGNRN